MSNQENSAANQGFALVGLIVGLFTGLVTYAIVEFWIDDNDAAALPITVFMFVGTLAPAFLLLAERGGFRRAGLGAFAIAAFLFFPDWHMTSTTVANPTTLIEFPMIFWVFLTRGLVAYLLVTLIKASFESGAPPRYAPVFFHGITMPLIVGGAGLIAGLSLILLFVWARLLKELDFGFFNRVFQEPWFILPFLGAIGGLSIAMMRKQEAVLGALRFVLLLLSRVLILITALASVTLLIVLLTKGTGAIFERPFVGSTMIALAFAGMLIFNGVYQNGEGGPPPLWLRAAAIVTLVSFPVYAGLAFAALGLRVAEYGLTPTRVAGFAMNGLAALYSLVCLAGLLSEANWRAKRWMAPVGPLNIAMAFLWVVVLTALATPLANPWAMSARSQEKLLAEEQISVEDFDFGFMQFELGPYGQNAFDRLLALDDHPQADVIRAEIERARAAQSRWAYENPDAANGFAEEPDAPAPETPGTDASSDSVDSLEFNPEGAAAEPVDEPETTLEDGDD